MPDDSSRRLHGAALCEEGEEEEGFGGGMEEEDRELDSEGRAVVTDHGAFVVINIYVPALSIEEKIEERFEFKMRFLAVRWGRLLQSVSASGASILSAPRPKGVRKRRRKRKERKRRGEEDGGGGGRQQEKRRKRKGRAEEMEEEERGMKRRRTTRAEEGDEDED